MSKDIDKIITRYLKDSLDSEEQTSLEEWLNENEDHPQQLSALKKIWKTSIGYAGIVNQKDEREKIWKRLHPGMDNDVGYQSRKKPIYTIVIRYAAIFLLIATFVFVIGNYVDTSVEPDTEITIIQRNNPAGQKSILHLPDGSTVWLNAGSSISYASDFNNHSRTMELRGEAFFEVAKNPEIPFEVHTDGLIVTAVGTSFNVHSFGEDIEQIALNTGKVRVEYLDEHIQRAPSFLNPGEMAIYNSNTGKLKLTEFEDQDPFAWKDGRIIFKHATFEEVITVLSRWYNVEFEVNGTLEQEWNYTSTFDNVILENVLASLKFSESIDYKIEGSTVKIILKS